LLPGQRIQGSAGLPRIASHFGHAFFMGIEFFQNNHGQEDVVFLKAKQAHGVV
jgi:hypothetical protein